MSAYQPHLMLPRRRPGRAIVAIAAVLGFALTAPAASVASSFPSGASSNGSKVFFTTDERLVPNDVDSRFDVYQRSGGTTTRVSRGQIKGNGSFDAFFADASSDGSRVFFFTGEKLVSGDTDASEDVYERAGGTTTQVSQGEVNGNGAFDAFFSGASNDGSKVFFSTFERLAGGDTDVFLDVYERSAGATTQVSRGQINGNGDFDAFFSGASSDGSRVFLSTSEQLVNEDADEFLDVYERAGGTTTQVSQGEVNGSGDLHAFFADASSDGSRVVFFTDEQLVSGDTDSSPDVYERAGGITTQVSQGEVNGNGAFEASFAGASSDGSRVFFTTDEQLVSGDTDSRFDVYQRSAGATTQVSEGADQRQRRLRRLLRRRIGRRLARRLRHRRAAGERRHRQLAGCLRALRGEHDPDLPGRGERQRRLRGLLRGRLRRRLGDLLRDQRGAGERRHRQLRPTSTSAPGGPRPRSPRAR